jgi:hypothetical protein
MTDLERTLKNLENKLKTDTKSGDAVQIDDDNKGIALAEEELDNIYDQMFENGCFDHAPPPPPPPNTTIVLTPSTIRPGEGFKVTWSFSYAPTTTKFGIGDDVFVQIFLGLYSAPDAAKRLETKLWEQTDIAFPPADSAIVGPYIGGTVPIIPIADVATKLYKVPAPLGIGVTVHVDGDGPEGPYEAGQALNIEKWTVDSTWWQWTVPAVQTKEWKSDSYILSGILTNESAAAMIGANIQLMEIEDGGPATPISAVTAGRMAGGATFTAAFPAITKNWSFISGPPFWKIDGPTNKVFEYYVAFMFSQDEYGNIYGDLVNSSRVTVQVDIAGWKLAAAFTAQAAVLEAAILSALAAAAFAGIFTSFEGPPLLALAAEAYAAATLAGEIAQDPPTPDPRYREPVEIPDRVHSSAGPDLPKISEFLATLNYTLELERARLAVPGRLMAARYFNDRPAAAIHEQTYRQILKRLSRAIGGLQLDGSAAKDELANQHPIPQALLADIAAKAREGSLAVFSQDNVPAQMSALVALLRDQDTMARAVTLGPAGVIDAIVHGMLSLGYYVPRRV